MSKSLCKQFCTILSPSSLPKNQNPIADCKASPNENINKNQKSAEAAALKMEKPSSPRKVKPQITEELL